MLLIGLAGCATVPVGVKLSGQSCPLDRQAAFPIERQANFMLASVMIDGKPARLLVDTAAERSMVTDTAARRLGLPRDPHRLTRVQGFGGSTTNWDAKANTLVLGDAEVRNLDLTVGPSGQDKPGAPAEDGLLGLDVLATFDVEVDPIKRQVILYRPRPCSNVLPPWQGPFMTVSSIGPLDGEIRVPITLDGVHDTAILDTGAQHSSVSERLAFRTGVTRQQLDHDLSGRSRGVSNNAVVTHLHRFRSLRVGTTLIASPLLVVLPLPKGAVGALGANYLCHQRLYLSFVSRRFFLAESTPAAGSAGWLATDTSSRPC